jgi:antitoxin component YwqK of YwqJK toxin-antitoxin module
MMRLGWLPFTVVVIAGPTLAVSRKDQPPDCEPGTHWHEEQDLTAYTMGDGSAPGRVGWCEKTNGTRHGVMHLWWPNGWLAIETTWADGVETGPARTFYQDGTPELQTTHVEGRPFGRFTQWHPNGKRAFVMWYDQGLPHGWAQYWDAKGALVAEGTYAEGKKVGTWEAWHPNGVFKESARYRDGRLDGRQLVFTSGGVFDSGRCWNRGELVWQTKSEVEAGTRECRRH